MGAQIYPNVINFWATVCKTVCPLLSYLSLHCLSCPVCDVGVFVGQRVGWIRMPLGMEEGLSSGHTVLDIIKTQLPDGKKHPPFSQFTDAGFVRIIRSACLLFPNGWMDQDGIWHEARPRPRPHCVRWRPSPPNKGAQQHPNFHPMSIVVKRLAGSRCHLVRR